MTDHYDDRYDGHDEYDDELGPIDEGYGEPDAAGQVHNAYVGDAQTLLKRAIDIVATAPTMPLSSSPRIDRDDMVELLEEALQRDRKSTRLNSSHSQQSRMPSSA